MKAASQADFVTGFMFTWAKLQLGYPQVQTPSTCYCTGDKPNVETFSFSIVNANCVGDDTKAADRRSPIKLQNTAKNDFQYMAVGVLPPFAIFTGSQ